MTRPCAWSTSAQLLVIAAARAELVRDVDADLCDGCGSAGVVPVKRQVLLELDEESYQLLRVLKQSPALVGTVARGVVDVLQHLVASAADGVRRPGAWERGWIEQSFGEVNEDAIEQDPEVEWYVRPRRGGR